MILYRIVGLLVFALSIPMALHKPRGWKVETSQIFGLRPGNRSDPSDLAKALALKKGNVLQTDAVARSIDGLFATGRFEDIIVEADPSGAGVTLTFSTQLMLFIGNMTVQGKVGAPPNLAQIAAADQLSLGACT